MGGCLGLMLLTANGCGDDKEKHCRYPLDPAHQEGETVECVDLKVPNRWDNPNGSTMNLHLAVFRADPEAPTPRAWLWLLGGPGQSWATSTEIFSPEVIQNIGQDLIILDQRGVGFNSPKLDCSDTKVPDQSSIQTYIEKCVEDLRREGVVIEGYTTWEMARDIEAARTQFGYESLDLLGVSYGTRLALEYLRLFPKTSHTVALDSVWPPQYRLFETSLVARNEAVDELFAACDGDDQCQEDFPDLETQFESVYSELEAKPLGMDDDSMDGDSFVGLLVSTILSFYPPVAPAVIYEMAEAIEKSQEEVPSDIKLLFEKFNVSLDESGGDELLISVTCAENQDISLEEIQAKRDVVRPSLHGLAGVIEDLLYPACLGWPSVPVPDNAFDPVVNSDVPVLMMSGRLDPRTPVSWALENRQYLAKYNHVILEHQGHSVSTKADGCLFRYALQFMKAGVPPEDYECDASLDPEFFGSVSEGLAALGN